MFKEFQKVEKKDWVEKANNDLKGVDVFEKYNWTSGNLKLKPYYDQSDLQSLDYLEAFSNRLALDNDPSGEPRIWHNLQRINVEKEVVANTAALNALMNGADGIEFIVDGANLNLDTLLKDIKAEHCLLSFQFRNKELILPSFSYLTNDLHGVKNIHLNGQIGNQLDIFNLIQQNATGIKLIEIPTTTKKSSAEEQVASVLIEANRQIRSLVIKGADIKEIVNSMTLTLDVGTDFFIEIAKIKALRILFFQLAQAYDYTDFCPEDIHIKCISTVWGNDQYGPHENMLKSSTAAFSAILGGCDSLIVTPENESDVAVRIARNVSSVLKDESYLSKAADPVAGTYYIESITDQLAKNSWELFQNDAQSKNSKN